MHLAQDKDQWRFFLPPFLYFPLTFPLPLLALYDTTLYVKMTVCRSFIY
jgi:hypothetical protein